MKNPLRIFAAALALLLVFFSLPLWLPQLMAPTAAASAPSLQGDPVLLLWSNDWQMDSEVSAAGPRLVAWQPDGELAWTLETGYSYGAVVDGQHAYLVEDPVRNAYEPEALLQLSVVDLLTGERISQMALRGNFLANLSSGAPVPVLVLDGTLYFTNQRQDSNLAAYDLASQTLDEARYDLCERGYPVEFEYLASQHAMVSLCIEFGDEMQAYLTRVSLADGEQHSLELLNMTVKEHYSANGLVVGPDGRVYVLNSSDYSIMEIDPATMQTLRQANYSEGKQEQGGLLQAALDWLLEQAACPAQAKMLFAVTALSPDGSQLAVAGSMLHGNQRELYVVDLASLQTVQRMRMPGLAAELAFADADTLVVVYPGQQEWSQAAALDLDTGEHAVLPIPAFGYLRELFVLAGQR